MRGHSAKPCSLAATTFSMKIEFLIVIVFLFSCNNATNDPTQITSADTLPNSQKKVDTLQSQNDYPDLIDEQNISKAQVSKDDSSFYVFGNIKKDYRIFGYENPDTNSKRLILFSVFTRDVENNPYKCRYGAFYQTSSMENMEIKYQGNVGSFIKTEMFSRGKKVTDLFFDKNWIEFDND